MFRKKKNKAAPVQTAPEGNELEQITAQLKAECGEIMERRFQQLIRGYSPENPMENEDAIKILKLLLREAVSHREKYVGRVESGIENGGLFDRYYGKLAQLNAMTIEANASLQRMEAAREDYLKKRALHKQAENRVYVDMPDSAAAPTHDPEPDLWDRLFRENGQPAELF